MTRFNLSLFSALLVSLALLAGCSGSSDSEPPAGDTGTPPTDQTPDDDPDDTDSPGDNDDPPPADDPQDTDEPVTLTGRVINGPLDGAELRIRSEAGELLAEAQTDAEGRYVVTLTHPGPYIVEAHGGLLDGEPYSGELVSACGNADGCDVTPFSTVLKQIMERESLDEVDARAALGNRLGFHADPFTVELPEDSALDVEAVRQALDGGAGLGNWVEHMVHWFSGENPQPPMGVVADAPSFLDPTFTPDSACTGLSVEVEAPHYLVATRAQLIAALADPDDKADDRLVIGITANIVTGIDSGDDEIVYEGDVDLVLVGWKDDGSRPVLDGGNVARILRIANRGFTVTLADLHFRNGFSFNSPRGYPDAQFGGAIRSRTYEPMIIYNSVFSENHTNRRTGVGSVAGGNGGAIFAEGPLLIAHSRFEDNYARGYGGAVHSARSASICHSAFVGNEQNATGSGHVSAKNGGSAVSVHWQEGIDIYDTLFEDNIANGEYGGAVFSRAVTASAGWFPAAGEIRIGHSVFKNNQSRDGAAAVKNTGVVRYVTASGTSEYISGGHIRIYDSEFINNTTDSGAIIRAKEANVYIFNSLLEGNDGDTPVGMIDAVGGHFRGNRFIDNAQPVIEGPLRNLGANIFEGNRNPSLGPEGRIAFYHEGALHLVDPNGSNLETVKNVTYYLPSPTWSPDGTQLAYADGTYGITDLWRLDIGAGQAHRLTNNSSVTVNEPAWSSQDEIAYVRKVADVARTPYLIYVTTPSGGEGNQISGGSAAADHERWPSWRPDGERLILTVFENVVDHIEDGPPRLYTMGRTGANRGRKPGNITVALEPAYSPDASQVAYVHGTELVIRTLVTGDERRLGEGRSPSWSPDGVWLAYEYEGTIYRLNLESNDAEPIVVTEGTMPIWSP